MKRVTMGAVFALSVVCAPLRAQHDPTSFSFYLENDAWVNSDTGYTNGVRLAWTILRYRRGMNLFRDYNLGTTLDRGLSVVGLGGLRLDRLGLIPALQDTVRCTEQPERSKRRRGACTILNLSLAQTMYTPDSLRSTTLQPRDHPYAGFLAVTAGVTTLDSPTARDSNSWIAYTEVSNEILLGVTGHPSYAEDTQSWAHWTVSTASHRPLGWANQLRTAPQIGARTDIEARPKWWEYCLAKRCLGIIDERRRADLTSHTELLAGTYMVRLSQGLIGRIGMDFPDAVGALRIPVTAPRGEGEHRGIEILGQRYWWAAFGDIEQRYVPYNMFIVGGLADGGPDGWRTLRQITPRYDVRELAYGVAAGNSHFTLRGQYAYRTPEYDVVGFARANAYHGIVSLTITVASPAMGQ